MTPDNRVEQVQPVDPALPEERRVPRQPAVARLVARQAESAVAAVAQQEESAAAAVEVPPEQRVPWAAPPEGHASRVHGRRSSSTSSPTANIQLWLSAQTEPFTSRMWTR